jgi:hypothetical protein
LTGAESGESMSVSVNASELRDTFEFVSSGAPSENTAFVSLDTGKIYWRSALLDPEIEDAPRDLESSDRYLEVPHKNELDLGRRLAMNFVERELPNEIRTVADFFRRRGAYARFRELLRAEGLLTQWYEFENRAVEEALRAWCRENAIQLVDNQPDPDRKG